MLIIIISGGKVPSLFWVGTTKVRFLGIWVSVWVGGSVANVKQRQVVLPTKKSHSDLVTRLSQAYFETFLFGCHWCHMALLGRRRGGCQWRLTELNGLRKSFDLQRGISYMRFSGALKRMLYPYGKIVLLLHDSLFTWRVQERNPIYRWEGAFVFLDVSVNASCT